tara:strand:+ start:196 stop:402 length:207 start_codon:yes stop_codon:yes gene_type:complete
MSITLKIVNLIDKLRLQRFFMEEDNKVMLNFILSPDHIEDLIDDTLKVDGKTYSPNQFEMEILKDLEW